MSKTPVKAAPGTAASAKKAAASKAPAKAGPVTASAKSAAAAKAAAKAPAKTTARPAAPTSRTSAPVAAKALPKPAAHAAPDKAAAKSTPLAAAPAVKPTPLKTSSKSAATKAARLSAAAAEPMPGSTPLPPPSRPPASNVVDLPRPARKIDPKLVNVWKTKAGRELTEDELQAMPDGEYMNDKQLDFFRAQLEKQRNDLLDNAGETTEHLREDTSIVPDPADRATIEEEHALELRTRDRERKLLKKISQSLARIESGEYGFCDETGEPIGLGRLLARPTATLSLEAQQRREMKQKMFGD